MTGLPCPPGEHPPGEADEAAAELTLLFTMSRGPDRAPDCPPPPLLLRDESGGRPEEADPAAAAEGELLRPDGDTVLLNCGSLEESRIGLPPAPPPSATILAGERPFEW